MNALFISTDSENYIDPDVYKIIVIIFLIVVFLSFFTTVLKNILDHKLKNKMLEKELSEEIIATILQNDSQSIKHTSVKWFLVLIATGIGLFISNLFLPLGIHSIGIMAISIASAFLVNAIYLNRFSS
ncbi:hypothetical protein [Tenacibaculum amylolyticum]|uniref:hypothetical protein n=1 Tax=Tenacibaculum amylolyticum TaxID=104269 RepID=UPI0038943089